MTLLTLFLLAPAEDPAQFFETRVRPVFAMKCHACHSGKVKMGGLDLQDPTSFREVTENGVRMLKALSYEEKTKMPPSGKLPAEQIADLKAWVETGAPWPAFKSQGDGLPRKAGKSHWAFQPVKKEAPPAVKGEAWVKAPIDRFILFKLEQQNLKPAAPASKLALLRRLTYDLTGLPPTPQEIEAFLNDNSGEEAYARVVERLLDSPQYGEHWGRHWLDVARYADSTGMDEDHMYPHAWRYRDYVVKAFNHDKPFDRFVQEQIAGDLLDPKNPDAIVATGFLALGPKPLAQQDRVQMVYDVIDEQIDVTSKAILGITMACARCHDHKFDPILTRDYYSMAAIYANTKNFRNNGRPGAVSYIQYTPLDQAAYDRWQTHRRETYAKQMEMEEAIYQDLDQYYKAKKLSPELAQASKKWLDRLESWRIRFFQELTYDRDLAPRPTIDADLYPEFAKLSKEDGELFFKDTPRVAALRAEWKRLEEAMPPEPPMASAVMDGPPVEQHVFVRGDHHNPGAIAPKAFPIVLSDDKLPAIASGSGRLELARFLTDPANPLTARVIVNRVWQWHFGEGIVRSPNNWGTTGEKPTHPELLDYLANRFVELGWSFKALHREILLSSAYRMGTRATLETKKQDPGNRLFSRFSPRRMTVEEIRDSVLAIGGSLDRAIGGSLIVQDKTKKRPESNMDKMTRRTMYAPVRRGSIPTLLSTFDYGDATTSSEGRTRTNVAPQALFMMNSEFVREHASRFAARLMEQLPDDARRVEHAYLTVIGRKPEPAEIDQALTYAAAMQKRTDAAQAWQSLCRVLIASNEFLYIQ